MSELHEALTKLGPVDFSDVPLENLAEYLQSHLEAGELICNSVPQPPGGDPFHSAKPSHSQVDLAASSKDIAISSARGPPPHETHVSLQDSWGKPLKLYAKDNPLDVKVYKMAAHDRHGAWFARRSVHEGISFSRMRKAMRWEFPASMAVEGGPGAGAVRGLAVDSRLEQRKVGGLGQAEVLQLSAQFPGPTTPREFITLLLTSEDALSDKSAADGKYTPRHLMVVSKPCSHPDATDRSGYIRGKYESVELIREIPLHKRSPKSASMSDLLGKGGENNGGRERGKTISFAESRGSEAKGEHVDTHETSQDKHDPDLNPVEWIMITRSDPGGGIPRFMVERGTPAGICGDVSKLFDWACSKDDIPDPDEEDVDEVVERRKSEVPLPPPEGGIPAAHQDPADTLTQKHISGEEPNGILATAQKVVEAYAPAAVADFLHGPEPNGAPRSSYSASSSTTSYESADDYFQDTLVSAESLPLSDTLPSDGGSSPTMSRVATGFSSHDKEIQKLDAQRRKLESRLAKKRESEETRLASSRGKSEAETAKARDRAEREIRKLAERREKEVKKLEERKDREVDKARRKREKQRERDMVSRVTRERDDFRRRVEIVQRENELLRVQIGDVQRENTVLVQKLRDVKGGDEVMSAVRDELRKKTKRPESGRSMSSVG
ncbi:hypothetical protein CAC42_5524 [Sphaceloma murrayae]|uniref:DUF3074 domain-containing protein n=1 Tax=Sphaceloma murrayae TaxID=2082308 RepID=A0A2K1QYE4_9PEZI|nr:hypothetical protein CAC42_5524 [Sphaceloma murrayae]